MAPVRSQPEVGSLLRQWRERRRVTQLELALDAGISARHLSFVETGRSQPGRDMLLRVLEQLKVPFREQNRLLLAAGHAPAYPERSFDDPELVPVRDAVATGDGQLAALIDEVAGYPVPEHEAASEAADDEMLGPVRVRTPDGGELAFFGMFASFDTPFEVTTSELAVELLFPADRATAERLHDGEAGASRG